MAYRCLFLFLISIQLLSAQLAPVCFNPVITHTQIPDFCFDLVSEDFDNDGLPDIVACVTSSDQVFVMKGNGDGTFNPLPNPTFATGSYPHKIVSADFNGDGNMDVATVNGSSNNISLLLGTGTGSFLQQIVFPVGNFPKCLVQGDFNNDGNSDIAVSNYLSGNVSLLLGTGTGSFLPLTSYAVLQGAEAITTGDYNNDGNADLAVSVWTSEYIQLLYGNGNGTFLPTIGCPVYTFNNYADAISTADLNNDGYDDLIVRDGLTAVLSILLGTPSFTMAPYYNSGTTSYYNVHGMAVGDINGDGTVDIISPTGTNIFRGIGNGTFVAAVTNTNYSGASVIVKDFNLDGKPDLGVIYQQLHIVLNQPVIKIANTPTILCAGHTVTLNAYGANSYTWATGQQTPAIVVSPMSTTGYTVTGTGMPGCFNKALITLSVVANTDSTMLASMSINSSAATTICAGTPVSICVNGGATYTWSTGSNANCVFQTPTLTTSYSVSVHNPGGCPKNMSYTQYVDVCSSVQQFLPDNSFFRIYPNPGFGMINVESDVSYELTILDCSGKLINHVFMEVGNHALDLSNYPPGIYTFLKQCNNQHTKAVKFVLQH